jgi:hypothetical protein
MTHHATTTNAIPRRAHSTAQPIQHDHATTAQGTAHQRFKITNFTAHPCITIRRDCEGPLRARCESILERSFVDLESRARPC